MREGKSKVTTTRVRRDNVVTSVCRIRSRWSPLGLVYLELRCVGQGGRKATGFAKPWGGAGADTWRAEAASPCSSAVPPSTTVDRTALDSPIVKIYGIKSLWRQNGRSKDQSVLPSALAVEHRAVPDIRDKAVIVSPPLILSPVLPALHALVESRHRLIGTANLHLAEVRRSAVAILGFTASYAASSTFPAQPVALKQSKYRQPTFRPVYILPAFRTAQDRLGFLQLKILALVVPLVEHHLIRASTTLEAVLSCFARIFWAELMSRQWCNDEHVAA